MPRWWPSVTHCSDPFNHTPSPVNPPVSPPADDTAIEFWPSPLLFLFLSPSFSVFPSILPLSSPPFSFFLTPSLSLFLFTFPPSFLPFFLLKTCNLKHCSEIPLLAPPPHPPVIPQSLFPKTQSAPNKDNSLDPQNIESWVLFTQEIMAKSLLSGLIWAQLFISLYLLSSKWSWGSRNYLARFR